MTDLSKTPSWFLYPEYNWQHKHVVIIGAGIAGCQMAWHLCQKNWQVTLIERHHQIASEASGNPLGVISPKMTAGPSIGEDFYTQAFHYTLSLLKSLSQLGHGVDWEACGVLQLAHNPREVKRWHALVERNLPINFIQLLNEEQTNKVSGISFHSEKTYKSSYFPKGGWIKPASFACALSQHPNCKIITETEAIKLKKTENSWSLLNSSKQELAKSEVVIITSGKDLNKFSQSSFLPAMPVAGQTTIVNASGYSGNLKTVIGHEGYLTPAINISGKSKQHIFGATFERDISKPSLNTNADNINFECLKKYLPEFANSLDQLNSAHTAVRMTTPDRFPYVGALPDIQFYQQNYHDLHQGKQWKEYPAAHYQKGLFVLGGLGSRGLITSGLCANALTHLLENHLESEQEALLLQQCHPARFIIKNLKRGI